MFPRGRGGREGWEELSHPHVPKGRGGLPWEVMKTAVRLRGLIPSPVFFYPQIAGRGMLKGKLPPTQMLSLFPATNVEPDLGKGFEC